jgi:hypothetical protein
MTEQTNTEEIKPNFKHCSICKRWADCFKDKCSYCSQLDFLYSQGAMSLNNYNKLMQEWVLK